MEPLKYPSNTLLLDQFRSAHGLPRDPEQRKQLVDVVRAFAAIPYENLTKILKDAESGTAHAARRTPQEVLADHHRWRTGGTCFSLTATLLHLVRSLGLEAQPILADRRYGSDTHCAMIVWIDEQPHLLDPGYLIVEPVPLASMTSNEQIVSTPFNQIQLVSSDRNRLDLYTIEQQNRRYRLTFKTSPVDESQFRRAWEASFDWEMMRYPLLTTVQGNQQLYMRGGYLQRRSPSQVHREEIPAAQVADRIAAEFGIHPEVVHKTLQILRCRGD